MSSAPRAPAAATRVCRPGIDPPALAVVTGAVSGIGLELANELARYRFDLVVAAESGLDTAGPRWRPYGAHVELVAVDLASPQGVTELHHRVRALDRPVDTASRAFLRSYAAGMRAELRGTGVTVTTLDLASLRRSGPSDTVDVAHAAFRALLAGDEHVGPGLRGKVAARLSALLPSSDRTPRRRRSGPSRSG